MFNQAIRALWISVFIWFGGIFPPQSAHASAHTAQICDDAARYAAQNSGVPLSVLQAITRTETGRRRNGETQPWPWTVNMEGKGVWFTTEDEARAYVFKHFKRGARSFDVGCFQINYKWHHKAFRSIDEMFDPRANAAYAAKFLSDLYRETGDWSRAAGAYHSRTPKYATKYRARFDALRARLQGNPPKKAPDKTPTQVAQAAVKPARPRVNTFPLLQAGSGQMGSLVPLQHSNSRGLFAPKEEADG